MALVITGSEGNVGRRLMAAFPQAVGVDRRPGAAIVADLSIVDYSSGPLADAIRAASGLIHLATSPDPAAADPAHYTAVVDAARLVAACAAANVPRLVLASSDWAAPKAGWAGINTYGHSKRVFEALAEMYAHAPGRRAVALRIGWVPRDRTALVGAPDWLRANYWDDERLIAEVTTALGPLTGKN
jgi:nucleoside-diphosphate-sugar epimerase